MYAYGLISIASKELVSSVYIPLLTRQNSKKLVDYRTKAILMLLFCIAMMCKKTYSISSNLSASSKTKYFKFLKLKPLVFSR